MRIGDWSSVVCSSDLDVIKEDQIRALRLHEAIGLLRAIGGFDLEGVAFEVPAQGKARRFRIVDDQGSTFHAVADLESDQMKWDDCNLAPSSLAPHRSTT